MFFYILWKLFQWKDEYFGVVCTRRKATERERLSDMLFYILLQIVCCSSPFCRFSIPLAFWSWPSLYHNIEPLKFIRGWKSHKASFFMLHNLTFYAGREWKRFTNESKRVGGEWRLASLKFPCTVEAKPMQGEEKKILLKLKLRWFFISHPEGGWRRSDWRGFVLQKLHTWGFVGISGKKDLIIESSTRECRKMMSIRILEGTNRCSAFQVILHRSQTNQNLLTRVKINLLTFHRTLIKVDPM